jgi:hypothetical protein
VGLASRGLRDLDGRPERIEDRGELASVRAQARSVLLRSLLAAVLASAAVMMLP